MVATHKKPHASGVDFALIEKTAFANADKPKVKAPPKVVAPSAPPDRNGATRPSRHKSERGVTLHSLLRERGIDYSNPDFDANTWLPLDVFDDVTAHLRTPEEWVDVAFNSTRVRGRQAGQT